MKNKNWYESCQIFNSSLQVKIQVQFAKYTAKFHICEKLHNIVQWFFIIQTILAYIYMHANSVLSWKILLLK